MTFFNPGKASAPALFLFKVNDTISRATNIKECFWPCRGYIVPLRKERVDFDTLADRNLQVLKSYGLLV